MADETALPDGDETLTELEYYQRLQPAREAPYEVGAAFLAAFASVLGLAAWYFRPLLLGTIAIACAIGAMSLSGGRNTRIGMILASTGWFFGVVINTLLERKLW